MEIKHIVLGVMSIVVAIAITMALLVPVVADSTSDTKNYDNSKDGLFRMTPMGDALDCSIVWDPEKPKEFTINGESYAVSLDNVDSAIIVGSTSQGWMVKYGYSGTYYYIQCFGMTTSGAIPTNTTSATVGYNAPITITISGGKCTVTTTDNEGIAVSGFATMGASEGFVIYPQGDYVHSALTQRVYIIEGSPIFAMGNATVTQWFNRFVVQGTADAPTASAFNPSSMVVSDVQFDARDVNRAEAITVSQATMVVTSGETVANVTLGHLIVPAEVTVSYDPLVSGPTAAMVSILPLLVLVGLVLGAVALFISRRD